MKRLMILGLVLALSLCCTGCGRDGAEEQVVPETVTATPIPTPTPIPNLPVPPAIVLKKPNAQQEVLPVEVAVEIHGRQELVLMTPVWGSFASTGGPDFQLLVDTERYQVNEVEGYCYLTVPTGMSGDVYGEIGFRPGVRAKDLAATILSEYGVMNAQEAFGTRKLGDHEVLYVQGQTIQNIFDVYLLEVSGGCLTLVTSTTPETDAHKARLTACLESLTLS